MSEAKKDPVVVSLAKVTPAEAARSKKARDGRRKAIRAQNAGSKMK